VAVSPLVIFWIQLWVALIVSSLALGLFIIASNDVLTRPPTPSPRQKIHRNAIDAIAPMRRRRAIGKDMAEMAAATAAMHFAAHHAKDFVLRGLNRAFDRIIKTRPAGSAFELPRRRKEPLSASGADENARTPFVIKRAASRRLRAMRAHDAILLRGEKAAPLLVGMRHLEHLALHDFSLLPTRKPRLKHLD